MLPAPSGVAYVKGARPSLRSSWLIHFDRPPPRPPSEPLTVQRMASNTGVVMGAARRLPSATP